MRDLSNSAQRGWRCSWLPSWTPSHWMHYGPYPQTVCFCIFLLQYVKGEWIIFRIIEGGALGKLVPSSHWSNKIDQTSNSDKLSGFSAWTWLTPLPKGPSQSSALRHHPPPLGAQPAELGLLCPVDKVWLKGGEAAWCLRKTPDHVLVSQTGSDAFPPFFAGKQSLGPANRVLWISKFLLMDSKIFLLMKTVLTKADH